MTVPRPVRTVTLFFFISIATPSVSSLTIPSLRAIIGFEVEPDLRQHDAVVGGVVAGCLVELDDSSSALDGMQPTLRQVPPRAWRFSTRAVLRPSWAARMAHT